MGRLLDSNLSSDYDVFVKIGNGFDLECNLPTSYGDFLNFITAIDYVSKDDIKKLSSLNLNVQVKNKIICKYTNDQHSLEPFTSLQNNIWYQHFLGKKIKQGWIDFENEIAKVI